MLKGIRLINVIFILIGAGIFSFGIVNFNMANNLAEGGVTGITLLLYFLFKLDPSLTNILLNLPLFFIGWKLLGRMTFMYTLIGTFGVSIFLYIFQQFPPFIEIEGDLVLAALFAGLFIGTGLGIIFRFGGTTGGVDIIARLGQKFMGWSIGRTMFMFDACVILLSLITYLTYREAMYTLIAVFVGAKLIDFIQETAYIAKGAIIISEKNSEILTSIHEEMGRGATILKALGTYSGIDKNVIYTVVSKNEIVRLKNIISSIDPHAFVSVVDVHEVLGEGFTLDENKMPLNPEI